MPCSLEWVAVDASHSLSWPLICKIPIILIAEMYLRCRFSNIQLSAFGCFYFTLKFNCYRNMENVLQSCCGSAFTKHLFILRSEYECFQIELSKNYGHTEWREDIKNIMFKAGLQNQQITFLFVDTQVYCRTFLPSDILDCIIS